MLDLSLLKPTLQIVDSLLQHLPMDRTNKSLICALKMVISSDDIIEESKIQIEESMKPGHTTTKPHTNYDEISSRLY